MTKKRLERLINNQRESNRLQKACGYHGNRSGERFLKNKPGTRNHRVAFRESADKMWNLVCNENFTFDNLLTEEEAKELNICLDDFDDNSLLRYLVGLYQHEEWRLNKRIKGKFKIIMKRITWEIDDV